MLSVIMIQYNRGNFTRTAIESFRSYYSGQHEIILVDNKSPEKETIEIGKSLKDIIFMQNENNEGYGKANNRAAKIATGEVLLFLNNDTITQSDFVTPVMRLFESDHALGVVGPKLLNTDQSFQISAGALPSFGQELQDKILYSLYDKKNTQAERYTKKNLSHTGQVGWVSGAALFIDRRVFDAVGGFDEKMFMYFEDKDLCLRVTNSGKKVYYYSDASLIHIGSGSAEGKHVGVTERFYRSSQMYYYTKHRSILEQSLLKLYLKVGKRQYYG